MQQPVIQFWTAIHGKGFSGGALNRFQKPMHVAITSPSSIRWSFGSLRILANRGEAGRVAAVTGRSFGKTATRTMNCWEQVAFVDFVTRKAPGPRIDARMEPDAR
jgi:hypothetical protein